MKKSRMLAAAPAEARDEGRAPGASVCESSPAAAAADHTARGTRCAGAGSGQQDMPRAATPPHSAQGQVNNKL